MAALVLALALWGASPSRGASGYEVRYRITYRFLPLVEGDTVFAYDWCNWTTDGERPLR